MSAWQLQISTKYRQIESQMKVYGLELMMRHNIIMEIYIDVAQYFIVSVIIYFNISTVKYPRATKNQKQ